MANPIYPITFIGKIENEEIVFVASLNKLKKLYLDLPDFL